MKLFTDATIARLATRLNWKCHEGQYQLAALIEIYRYAGWMGFDTAGHIAAYEAQCKAIKHEFWEFPHQPLEEHRAMLDRLDEALKPADSYRTEFEGRYSAICKDL
jgi:hypothetical protein